jgi:anti-sigma regulatory factor (Ser/Thr protein kinase)
LFVLVDPVRLIASELATNAIVHAGTEFTLRLTGLSEEVVLAVEDEIGDGAIPLDAVSRPQQRLSSDIGGRGLLIVGMLSKEWGVTSERPGFKTVWASFPSQGV